MQWRWMICALIASLAGLLASCDEDGSKDDADDSPATGDEDAEVVTHEDAGADDSTNKLSFFVTSDKSMTGDLGGLPGADARCQALAKAVGAGGRTFHAYLSVEHDPANGGAATDARDRIGKGPWYNAKGALLAEDSAALHAQSGDPELFLDENGDKINGQWEGSPTPNEHDVLTGSDPDGRVLPGKTCADWTSSSASVTAQVGHTDGLGPNRNGAAPFNSWQSSHENMNCADTAPRGGAGRLYCFAID